MGDLDTQQSVTTLRAHAIQLRRAASAAVASNQEGAMVAITFESGRLVTPQGAFDYADELDRQADLLEPGQDEQRRQELLKAMDAAKSVPGAYGPGNVCNIFVRETAKVLHVPYFQDNGHGGPGASDLDLHTANGMYEFLIKASQSAPSGWSEVTADEAQKQADRGRFVLASAPKLGTAAPPGSDGSHGHIGLVVPSTWPHPKDPTLSNQGPPWIIIGQHVSPETDLQSESKNWCFMLALRPKVKFFYYQP